MLVAKLCVFTLATSNTNNTWKRTQKYEPNVCMRTILVVVDLTIRVKHIFGSKVLEADFPTLVSIVVVHRAGWAKYYQTDTPNEG
jgi:hypothetical protein